MVIETVAIIGCGRLGAALARRTASSRTVRIGSRDPSRGRALASLLGVAGGGSYRDVVGDSDILVLSVPWAGVEDALEELGEMEDKILIDTVNPFTDDRFWDIAQFPESSVAEQIQRLKPNARVVKAWNTVPEGVIGSSPVFKGIVANVFLCGDDVRARAAVAALIREVGFAPVDCGPLSTARYLESLAGLNARLSYGLGMGTDHTINVVTR